MHIQTFSPLFSHSHLRQYRCRSVLAASKGLQPQRARKASPLSISSTTGGSWDLDCCSGTICRREAFSDPPLKCVTRTRAGTRGRLSPRIIRSCIMRFCGRARRGFFRKGARINATFPCESGYANAQLFFGCIDYRDGKRKGER